MSTQEGRIENVFIRDTGSTLEGDLASGVQQLPVTDASDFQPGGGDDVSVDGITYTVSSIIYSADDDGTPDVLVLTSPTTQAHVASTAVLTLPLSTTKVAMVQVVDNDDDAVPAVVPYEMSGMLDEGVRGDESEQESVEVDLVGQRWEVISVEGETPSYDAEYITGDLPLPPDYRPTDPPVSSPLPTVDEGPEAAIVRFTPNGSIRYDLHIASVNTAAPSAATLVQSDISPPSWHTLYKDGTPLPIKPPPTPTGGTPAPDVYAYFAIVASNGEDPDTGADMPGPASPWVPGRMGYAAPNVLARRIEGETLYGVKVVAPNIDTDEAENRGVKLRRDGLRAYVSAAVAGVLGTRFFAVLPNEGVSILEGLMTLSSLTVKAAADLSKPVTSLGGRTSLPVGGTMAMQSAIQAPNNPPDVDVDYETFQVTGGASPSTRRGWSTDGTYWYTARRIDANSVQLERYTMAGALDATCNYVVANLTVNGGLLGSGFTCRALHGSQFYNGSLYVLMRTADSDGSLFTTVVRVQNPNWGGNAAANTSMYRFRQRANNEPGLGIDLVNNRIVMAEPDLEGGDGRLTQLANTDLTTITQVTMPRIAANLVGVVFGSDPAWSGNRYAICREIGAASGTIVVDTTGGATSAADGWVLGTTETMRGLTKLSGRFVSLDNTGAVRYYESSNTADATRWLRSTFARGGSTSSTPTRETTMSPAVMISQPKRSRLAVTAAAVPANAGTTNDPDRVRIYMGTGSSEPARTASYLIAAPGVGVNSTIVTTYPTSGAVPPSSSTFATATPYQIFAQGGGFSIDGNSNGDVGTGTFLTNLLARVKTEFDADGRSSGLRAAILAAAQAQQTNDIAIQTLTAASPFAQDANIPVVVARVGRLVILEGVMGRSSGSSTNYVQAASAMATQFRPPATVLSQPGIIFNATQTYQGQVLTTGVFNIRMSTAFTAGMTFMMAWYV